ncbi:MAG TPA: hypothetical protein PLK34_02095 [Candidatus Pacearchaeota archaeon]|nr:hypothetical protein [Candidatus Pacearchaeota archaeon]
MVIFRNIIKEIVFYSLVFLIVLPSISAMVGVRPASYEVNFEPNLKKVFTFNFMGDPGVNFEIYTEGPFSEYVELSTTKLVAGNSVNALVQFPLVAGKPGRHRLLVGGMQVAGDNKATLGIVGNVQGVIFVNVPYPGKYAELDFFTSNANTGEDVDLTLKIYSKGEQDINTHSKIEIYDSEKKNLLQTIDLGENLVKSTEFVELKTKLNTSQYLSGDYSAKAIVIYEAGAVQDEEIFRLGKLFIDISNYTHFVERGKINRFEIQAESYWNDPISGVYANVSILNYSRLDFLTPSMVAEPWQKTTLTGYFDTSEIKQSIIRAQITLHYNEETTQKIVEIEFTEPVDYTIYIIIGGIGAVIIVMIGIIVILIKRKSSKGGNHGKKR